MLPSQDIGASDKPGRPRKLKRTPAETFDYLKTFPGRSPAFSTCRSRSKWQCQFFFFFCFFFFFLLLSFFFFLSSSSPAVRGVLAHDLGRLWTFHKTRKLIWCIVITLTCNTTNLSVEKNLDWRPNSARWIHVESESNSTYELCQSLSPAAPKGFN